MKTLKHSKENWQLIRLGMIVALGLILQGCSSGEDELRGWMSQQRQDIKPSIKPIAEPKQFVPANYDGRTLARFDPFDGKKLTNVLIQDRKSSGSILLDIENNRRKQPLEAYALDTMSMVGSLRKNGRLVGLVKVDNLLYQVIPGNYLGQNFGLVKSVDDHQIVLREIVQDAAGEWIERAAALEIQEK
jgi:type IV pilus assembly protein PilP